MAKKIIRLTEEELHEFIKETTMTAVSTFSTPSYIQQQSSLIVEMARINKNETGKCIFPYNSWELKIWSNDHNPPHFHIINDGWDVLFRIDNGEEIEIKSRGRNSKIYDYMISNVHKWLDSTCFTQTKLTNRENAISIWTQLHDE